MGLPALITSLLATYACGACGHDNLRSNQHSLEALGYDQTFYRLWEFYLCYCEGGFLERSIGTAHLLLAKPGARPKPYGLKA